VRVFSRGELAERAERLSRHGFCQRTADIAAKALPRLLPRDDISTLDWSLEHRVMRKPDGTKTGWSRDLTPFVVPIMDAHDDPEVLEIIVPKPSRCGGTVIAENHALKRLDYGPANSIMWYLAGPGEVSSYADRVFRPIFEDHAAVAAKIGPKAGDNKNRMKRVGAQTIELMVMGGRTTTNREAGYIVFDEPDSYHKDFRSNFLEQGRQRQRMLGNDRKIYACAHPDIGWTGGIAAAWVLSTQGIYVMQCPECGGHASPYAPPKYWPDIPRFRLWYEKCEEGTPIDRRLAAARNTAGILCPHCGSILDERQRVGMVEQGRYMHKGQQLDIRAGIVGDPERNQTWGFWIHVLMSRQVGLGELASELEGAIEHKERTGKSDKLKQVIVRTFGEVFEGASDLKGLNAKALKDRARDGAHVTEDTPAVNYRMGVVPDGVKFLTAAIDVGGGKFDLLVKGWDLERRSWLIDRRTIRQRKHTDGLMRDIAPAKVQDDWNVLIDEIDRLYPLQADPAKALPVAVMTIDASDGNVTWKAYEFARRMHGRRWGPWQRVRCIKGSTNTKDDPLPATPKKISKDSEGRLVEPVVTLHVLGVHKLKEGVLDDLAIDDGAPGQCYFAADTPDKAFDELFNEVLIDGTFHRNGPNETLDLNAYAEAGRLMLQPDRTDRKWDDPRLLPMWARPVSLGPKGGDLADEAKGVRKPEGRKPSLFELHQRLNSLDEDQ